MTKVHLNQMIAMLKDSAFEKVEGRRSSAPVGAPNDLASGDRFSYFMQAETSRNTLPPRACEQIQHDKELRPMKITEAN